LFSVYDFAEGTFFFHGVSSRFTPAESSIDYL
jgi:hypothetical protein